jgi:hypothetical protein
VDENRKRVGAPSGGTHLVEELIHSCAENFRLRRQFMRRAQYMASSLACFGSSF